MLFMEKTILSLHNWSAFGSDFILTNLEFLGLLVIENMNSEDEEVEDWWLELNNEYMDLDDADSIFWSGKFLPPPPRPPYALDELAEVDGLNAACDLCGWAIQMDHNADGVLADSAPIAPVTWTAVLVVVSLLSALLGAIVMVIILHCKFRMNNQSRSQRTIFTRAKRRDANMETDNTNGNKDPENSVFQTWIQNRRAASIPLHHMAGGNHYTVEEAYAAISETVYTELDPPPSSSMQVFGTQHLPSNSNIPSYTAHNLPSNSNIPSFTAHNLPSNSSIPSFTAHNLPSNSNIPLFTAHNLPSNSNIPSFTTHHLPSNSNIPSFTAAHHLPSNNNIPSFMSQHLPSNAPVCLFATQQTPSDVELCSCSSCRNSRGQPSYQNSGYAAEDSAPSSAYYSDASNQDRGYEIVGENTLDGVSPWNTTIPKNRVPHKKTSHTLHSNYI